MSASEPAASPAAAAPVAPVLEASHVTAGYGRTTVLRDVSLQVSPGQVVALLGANGAGKTTLLRVCAGLLAPSEGTVHIRGRDVTKDPPFRRSRDGLGLIPEGRGIFPNLSVRENLALQIPPWQREKSIEPALAVFPALKDRLRQSAGRLSGGQQQMLALSRCFVSNPQVVLLDEVSMGLAPRVVDEIFSALKRLSESGVALLLVEQYVRRALDLSDWVYLLGRGEITFSGAPAGLDEDELTRRYVGGGDLSSAATATSPQP